MAYFEELTEGCPEADAIAVNNEQFYRFVSANPAVDADFTSHRKLYPKRVFQVPECQARSLSIFKVSDNFDLSKLPALKNKLRAIITLTPNDGVVKHTPSSSSKEHHSWWRSTAFQIANNITYP